MVTDLPGDLERIECVDCGHGVITNRANDVERCVACRRDPDTDD